MTNIFGKNPVPQYSPAPKSDQSLLEKQWKDALLTSNLHELTMLLEQSKNGGASPKITRAFNPFLIAVQHSSDEVVHKLIEADILIIDYHKTTEEIVRRDDLPAFLFLCQKAQTNKKPPNIPWAKIVSLGVEEKKINVVEEILLGNVFKSSFPDLKKSVAWSINTLNFYDKDNLSYVTHEHRVDLLPVFFLLLNRPSAAQGFIRDIIGQGDNIKCLLNLIFENKKSWDLKKLLQLNSVCEKSQDFNRLLLTHATTTITPRSRKMYKKLGGQRPSNSVIQTQSFLKYAFVNGFSFFEEYMNTPEGEDVVLELVKNQDCFKEFLLTSPTKQSVAIVKKYQLEDWVDESNNNICHYLVVKNPGKDTSSRCIKFLPSLLGKENDFKVTPISLLATADEQKLAEKAYMLTTLDLSNTTKSNSRKM